MKVVPQSIARQHLKSTHNFRVVVLRVIVNYSATIDMSDIMASIFVKIRPSSILIALLACHLDRRKEQGEPGLRMHGICLY